MTTERDALVARLGHAIDKILNSQYVHPEMLRELRAAAPPALAALAALPAGVQERKSMEDCLHPTHCAEKGWCCYKPDTRRLAMEEAAKVCELDSVRDWTGGSTGNAPGTAKACAAAIRALAAQQLGTKGDE